MTSCFVNRLGGSAPWDTQVTPVRRQRSDSDGSSGGGGGQGGLDAEVAERLTEMEQRLARMEAMLTRLLQG
jgi:hypothetical protein